MPTEVPQVYAAVIEVTEAIGKIGISKDRQNQQQGYKFRGIDQVLNALNPLLSEAKLCILPKMVERFQEERPTKDGKGVLFFVKVTCDFKLVSAKDGSFDVVTFYGEGMDSADKATNKAMSAAYKYMAFETFCIPLEGVIEDADATTPEPAPALTPEEQERDNLRKSIVLTGQNWLKKYMDEKIPHEFKRILGLHGCSMIDEVPVDYDKAKIIYDEVGEFYREHKKRKASGPVPVK